MIIASSMHLKGKETIGTQQEQNFPLMETSLPIHVELMKVSCNQKNSA